MSDTSSTNILTLSLHDALPILSHRLRHRRVVRPEPRRGVELHIETAHPLARLGPRSEEHTSELQSHGNIVCRLLLEKKKKQQALPTSESAGPYQYDPQLLDEYA